MPDNITLLPRPPYAPELNPIENVRACRPAIAAFRTCDGIVARCRDPPNVFAGDVATVRSITTRDDARTART